MGYECATAGMFGLDADSEQAPYNIVPSVGATVSSSHGTSTAQFDLIDIIGGTIQQDVSAVRRSVYLDARHAELVIEFNQIRARPVKEAIDALAPYLK